MLRWLVELYSVAFFPVLQGIANKADSEWNCLCFVYPRSIKAWQFQLISAYMTTSNPIEGFIYQGFAFEISA